MSQTPRERLAGLVGKELRVAIASVHYHQGELDDSPIEIWLGFDDGPLLQIRGSSNGDALTLGDKQPIPFKMDEYGEFMIRSLDVNNPLARSTGKTLSSFVVTGHDLTDDIKEILFEFSDASLVFTAGRK